jgi:hypothetical protein
MKKASALWNILQKRFFKIFKIEELRKNDFFLAKFILPMNQGPRWNNLMKKLKVKNLVVLSL